MAQYIVTDPNAREIVHGDSRYPVVNGWVELPAAEPWVIIMVNSGEVATAVAYGQELANKHSGSALPPGQVAAVSPHPFPNPGVVVKESNDTILAGYQADIEKEQAKLDEEQARLDEDNAIENKTAADQARLAATHVRIAAIQKRIDDLNKKITSTQESIDGQAATDEAANGAPAQSGDFTPAPSNQPSAVTDAQRKLDELLAQQANDEQLPDSPSRKRKLAADQAAVDQARADLAQAQTAQ